ncbi:class III lanthionine synthetase LanKC [Streptomyces sp. NPDC050211]|uniref:class III lanthionine synthetase LanKC n=1 Tax=Streptomyces sp. NPDC050211 TaxID=3154932 RepID=UPI00341BE968
MDRRYEIYCLADRIFYETPDRLSAVGAASLFEAALRPVPEGWRSFTSGDWLQLAPVDEHGTPCPGLPGQGWKIHVSACLDNAEKTAARLWDYCVPRGIPFKLVPGAQPLLLRNSKYASRGDSGKFATLYPADETELHRILKELGDLLSGEPGPAILSDLRWNEGPLYVRYGGFTERHCVDENGVVVPAVEDPDGRLVPDRRDPAFRPPAWVTLPEFLRPHLDARNATTTRDLPYRIERALHFSNGGGVYAGTDVRTGEQVVLKEARPYAGLTVDGADAVTRLEREKAALERLTGLGVAPGVRDWFTLGDHRFLVMDFLTGGTLNSAIVQRHPLLQPEPDPDAVAAYTRWALAVHRATETAVAAVHDRGLVFNDLHPLNIMLAPDDRTVRLLDFEAATPVGEHHGQTIAHPGFAAPADRAGHDVDHYALACLRLALFLPMTSLLVVDRRKAAHLAEIAAGQFPDLPREFLDKAVRVITGERQPGVASWLRADPAGGEEGPAGERQPGVARRLPADAAGREGGAAGGRKSGPAPWLPADPADRQDSPQGGALGARHRAADGVGHPSGARGGADLQDQRFDAARWLPADPADGEEGLAGERKPGVARRLPADPAGRPEGPASMVRAILRSATPGRDDRLLPGDIAQFSEGGGLGMAYGAAGVLYALDETGNGRWEEGEQWLLDHTDPPPDGTPPGFYDGLAGVAYLLDRLGHTGRALDLMTRVLDEPWQRLAPGLHGGLAGLGLTLDQLARTTGEPGLRDHAMTAARILAERDHSAGRRAGLLDGATGPALFFLRLYESTGDRGLLDHAASALRADLARCVRDDTGTLAVDEGFRTMPYLGSGSVGIGTVIEDYLAHRPDDEEFARARTDIAPAARSRYYAQPGLFHGRAGMILHLARTGASRADLDAQTAALGWYAMPYEGELAFPGEQMMRLSMDLATGTAGCLLAITAARPGRTAALPFLPPPPAAAAAHGPAREGS